MVASSNAPFNCSSLYGELSKVHFQSDPDISCQLSNLSLLFIKLTSFLQSKKKISPNHVVDSQFFLSPPYNKPPPRHLAPPSNIIIIIFKMLEEIKSVSNFFARWLSEKFEKQSVDQFKTALENEMFARFKNHWYPSFPQKGQAFRSILIDGVQTDPLLMDIASQVGINLVDFEACLPRNCVIFCDPSRVVCKDLHARENLYHTIYQGASSPSSDQSLLKMLQQEQQQKHLVQGVVGNNVVVSSN